MLVYVPIPPGRQLSEPVLATPISVAPEPIVSALPLSPLQTELVVEAAQRTTALSEPHSAASATEMPKSKSSANPAARRPIRR